MCPSSLHLDAQDGLGIAADVRQELVENVSVVIHVAATIRFHEKIKLATKMNIVAVKHVIALAKDLRHCAAVVQTSTAYAHTYRPDCPETFLEPSHCPEDLIALLDKASAEVADAATPTLIKRHPNTFVPTHPLPFFLCCSFLLLCMHRLLVPDSIRIPCHNPTFV